MSRGRVCRPSRETPEEQARRHSERGGDEYSSGRRLAAVWAEEEAEIEQRLKEVPEVTYKFACKHCQSRFSLARELEAHETECGKVRSTEQPVPAPDGARTRTCKYCGDVFKNFGEYGAHRWALHRKEVLADLARSKTQRKADEKKIDSAIGGKKAGKAPGASPQRRRTSPPASQVNGATCPTCGGPVSGVTADLVRDLVAIGISEAQAFEAARIARRTLGAGV